MTITTIDFDIFMWQDIECYNGNITSHIPFEKNVGEGSPLNFVRFDPELYAELTNLILRITPRIDDENTIFIVNHEDLVNYVPKDQEITLINIDHHHDWGYDDTECKELECGNWVHWLHKYYNIKNYIWVADKNSQDPDDFFTKKFRMTKENVHSFSKNKIIEDTNLLVLCLSPSWVPQQYQSLFDLWKDLINGNKS